MDSRLHYIPSGEIRRAVCLLHGYGADGQDLMGLVPMLAPSLPHTAFFSPHAPESCEMGFGYQWFSLRDWSQASMQAGAEQAAHAVHGHIDDIKQRMNIAEQSIALLGFSQGAMMALYTALRRPQPVAGVVGFSGALIGKTTLKESALSLPPVCLVHGEEDSVVPFRAMQEARDALTAATVSVEAHARPQLGHGIDGEGLEIATAFLARVLEG